MATFISDKSFWELFPEAKLGVLLLNNYQTPKESPAAVKQLLQDSYEQAKTYLTEPVFSDNTLIQTYRKAYQTFKTKKGARSSIESLLKRVDSGKPVTSISPLVDIYNAASLFYGLPCGAEDSDTFVGDLHLTVTEGGDDFYLIGSDSNSPTLAGELCYKDAVGAVCRCFNWRDGERTMITDKTCNAFVILELLDPSKEDDLKAAMDFIADKAKTYLNAQTKQAILTVDNPQMQIS